MHSRSILAASGALFSLVAAVPMAKREVVWVTETAEDIVTVPVTKTVWVSSGETHPAATHYGHHYGLHSKFHSASSAPAPAAYTPPASPAYSPSSQEAPAAPSSSSPVYVAPSPSTSSPAYVAPAPTSSSSVYVAPVPTTPSSVYVAPVPTTHSSTYVAPATSAAPSPSPSPSEYSGSSGGSSSGSLSGMAAAGKEYKGDLTWYQTGMGSCGIESGSNDKIVAVSHIIFDSYGTGNPNNNPVCGKTVTITGKNGSSYTAKVVDRCTGCAADDLDLSEGFFNEVTDHGDGRVPGMSWSFE